MQYWPFSSEKKRARIPFMNLAGFSTWCKFVKQCCVFTTFNIDHAFLSSQVLRHPTSTVWSGAVVLLESSSLPMTTSTVERCSIVSQASRKPLLVKA